MSRMGGTADAMWRALGTNAGFPDPFRDFSSLSMPTAWKSINLWVEYVWGLFGPYSAAHERLISYFLTSIDWRGVDEDEREKWEELSETRFPLLSATKAMLINRGCYGNAYASILTPFQRFLTCPRCFSSWRLDIVYEHNEFSFSLQGDKFKATCPRCKVGSGFTGDFMVDDRSTHDTGNFTVKIWSPHDIELVNDPWTGDNAYFWRIPEDYKNQLRAGPRGASLQCLERVPLPVLEAITKNQFFQFDPDTIFHMREPTLAGIMNRGYGLPRIFKHFRQIWYVQVLRRYNEALALDYVIPFRVITPAPRPGAGGGGGAVQAQDMLASMDAGTVSAQIRSMLRRRRFNPTEWYTLPFPVQYQRLGGDATELAPREMMDYGMEDLLLSIGAPVEFYKGTMGFQTAPTALRLINAQHADIPQDANRFIRWATGQVAEILTWEKPDARLVPVTMADDIERTMMAMQLMMNQQVSATSALRGLGYVWKDEQKKIMDEQMTAAQLQAELQEKLDQASMAAQLAKGQPQQGPAGVGGGMQPPGGGAPAGPAGPGGAPMMGPVTAMLQQGTLPQTIDEVMQTAVALATDLMGQPEALKDSELRQLSRVQPLLHSAVKNHMDKLRQGTRNAAGNAALGQWQASGVPPA